MDYGKEALIKHKQWRGKLAIELKAPLNTKDELATAYTPGVASPCLEIHKDKNLAYEYTGKGNAVAVVTDGTAVLGLGNIGAIAGMPVMEGKCALFKRFGNIDAYPICLDTQDPEEIITAVKNIAPGFGGINLEDIASPQCFEIERRLEEMLDIPVFHDDQHGTAIVTLAAVINALKIVNKKIENITAVLSGPGAAGTAIIKLLNSFGIGNIIAVNSSGIVDRKKEYKKQYLYELANETNKDNISGGLSEAVKGADMFIGVSQPGILTGDMVKTMKDKSIIFAMSNPIPEIFPDVAIAAGAAVVGTGRSDFANQINNVLAFPGIFRGALDARSRDITPKMKVAAAIALADFVADSLSAQRIIPSALEDGVAAAVAKAVKAEALK